jgi:hypothetical protein
MLALVTGIPMSLMAAANSLCDKPPEWSVSISSNSPVSLQCVCVRNV